MRLVLYIALVVVMVAPMVWGWNPIRRWLSPDQPLSRLLLRVLLLSIAFCLYAITCLWLTIILMGRYSD